MSDVKLTLEMNLPKHIHCSIEHNPHLLNFETVAEWAASMGLTDDDWVSDGDLSRAVLEDDVWYMQWYPDTPAGFHMRAAATLDRLLEQEAG